MHVDPEHVHCLISSVNGKQRMRPAPRRRGGEVDGRELWEEPISPTCSASPPPAPKPGLCLHSCWPRAHGFALWEALPQPRLCLMQWVLCGWWARPREPGSGGRDCGLQCPRRRILPSLQIMGMLGGWETGSAFKHETMKRDKSLLRKL